MARHGRSIGHLLVVAAGSYWVDVSQIWDHMDERSGENEIHISSRTYAPRSYGITCQAAMMVKQRRSQRRQPPKASNMSESQ